MKFKSAILIASLAGCLFKTSYLPAVVITFGQSSGEVQSIYLENCSAREVATEGFEKCSREVLDCLMDALCQDPSLRIYVSYQATLTGCDTAEMALSCLLSHGVPADRIIALEMPATDTECSEGFVEILLASGQGPQFSMLK